MGKSFYQDKKYYSITEVAKLCSVRAHTLRYWEKEFNDLKPITRNGNRRYYQKDDIELIKQINSLLHEKGLTIAGAKRNLKSSNQRYKKEIRIQGMIEDLENLLSEIK